MKKIIVPFLIFSGAIARVMMAGLPNIEPIMLVTMVSGVKYGPKYGLLVGLLTMLFSDLLIYGSISMFLVLPLSILALVSISTSLAYGFIGLFSGFFEKYKKRVQLAGIAAFLTLLYDLITNISWSFVMNIPLPAVLIAGIPFSIIHILSNALIIGITAPYLLKTLDALPNLVEQYFSRPIGVKYE